MCNLDNSVEVLYHGSEDIVSHPVYGVGSVRNDYGRGFYCTRSVHLAGEWACKSGMPGYVNKYTIALEGLRILNIGSRKYEDIMSWVSILLENRYFTSGGIIADRARNFLRGKYLIKNYRDYDIIIGYRADDSYFRYTEEFISGSISYEKFSNAIFLGKLGIQVVIVSKLAFSRLVFKSSKKVDKKYISRYRLRDSKARIDYDNLKDNGSILITDIIQRGY